jgi:hypothetical protein
MTSPLSPSKVEMSYGDYWQVLGPWVQRFWWEAALPQMRIQCVALIRVRASAATPGPNSVTLPEVAVFTPYSNCGIGPRVSSFGTIRTGHYEVPPGFDANVPLHPYTSGIGPRPGPGDKGTSMAGNKPPLHHNR